VNWLLKLQREPDRCVLPREGVQMPLLLLSRISGIWFAKAVEPVMKAEKVSGVT